MAAKHPAYTLIQETPDWIAVSKAAGVLSIPDREQSEPSLRDLLAPRYGRLFTVHRLDRETSGLILFARNEESHKFFSGLFEGRQMQKWYVGLVLGSPQPSSGSIIQPILEHPVRKGYMVIHAKGKLAHTDYELVESFTRYSWLRFQIHTGRTHQIRVHAQFLGTPLVADPLYGDGKPFLLSDIKRKFNLSKNEEAEKPLIGRVALHAHQLAFTDADGTHIQLEAPIPKDLEASLKQLRRRNS